MAEGARPKEQGARPKERGARPKEQALGRTSSANCGLQYKDSTSPGRRGAICTVLGAIVAALGEPSPGADVELRLAVPAATSGALGRSGTAFSMTRGIQHDSTRTTRNLT